MSIVIQIEDPAGLDRVEDIAAVPGVDVVFLGVADGFAGHFHDETGDLVRCAWITR